MMPERNLQSANLRETCYIEDSMSTKAIHPHFGTVNNRFLKYYDSFRERPWGLGPQTILGRK